MGVNTLNTVLIIITFVLIIGLWYWMESDKKKK